MPIIVTIIITIIVIRTVTIVETGLIWTHIVPIHLLLLSWACGTCTLCWAHPNTGETNLGCYGSGAESPMPACPGAFIHRVTLARTYLAWSPPIASRTWDVVACILGPGLGIAPKTVNPRVQQQCPFSFYSVQCLHDKHDIVYTHTALYIWHVCIYSQSIPDQMLCGICKIRCAASSGRCHA